LDGVAPDELASLGKLLLCADSHVTRPPIPAVVKNTFDAFDTGIPASTRSISIWKYGRA
jgi:hypothetical protein